MRRAAAAMLAAWSLGLAACATQRAREPAAPANGTAAISPVAPSVPAAEPGNAVFVAAALEMVGQPYHWGGTEPGGFDCSGLVVYAARRAGLELPRTAREQAQSGAAVGRAELRAGDLVFLHLARKELHVGIAVDAEHFVHAPSSGGTVRVDSLTAHPYGQAFLRARRLSFPR
jgi:cell wall-associated NlpC family hydrolase